MKCSNCGRNNAIINISETVSFCNDCFNGRKIIAESFYHDSAEDLPEKKEVPRGATGQSIFDLDKPTEPIMFGDGTEQDTDKLSDLKTQRGDLSLDLYLRRHGKK